MKIRTIVMAVALASSAHGAAALFVEEPYGHFGGLTPTGHAAVYLPRVCAETPVKLRMCGPGETGVVISRYHRVGGYDWIAIPLVPYLYAVNNPDEVPSKVNAESVAALRDRYRRENLETIIPDGAGGKMPAGDWTQLVGSSYDRTIYSFEVETTEEQDARLVDLLNARTNQTHFNLFLYNCADFARFVMDFYYPRAVHRGILNDLGIMTPKQAARTLAKYSRETRGACILEPRDSSGPGPGAQHALAGRDGGFRENQEVRGPGGDPASAGGGRRRGGLRDGGNLRRSIAHGKSEAAEAGRGREQARRGNVPTSVQVDASIGRPSFRD